LAREKARFVPTARAGTASENAILAGADRATSGRLNCADPASRIPRNGRHRFQGMGAAWLDGVSQGTPESGDTVLEPGGGRTRPRAFVFDRTMEPSQLALAGITLVAAVVNGALGYGFSSITVPLALIFLTNRVLNPALVPIEVALNAYVLWVNRASMPAVWRRVLPIVIGLVPGVMVGTALVSRTNPGWLKFATFLVLLPLIFSQAVGYRRPIRSERTAGFAFGGGLGVLYAVTTISGPPLAVMLTNQGLTKKDFRAGLGLIRLAESTMTGVAYLYAGLYSAESHALVPFILPSIVIGVPIGAALITRIRPDTFRRVCMSFDAWIVGFGLSTLLKDLGIVESNLAYLVLAAVGALDSVLLYRFFTVQLPMAKQAEALAPADGT
jgi:hypothetical protein